ncbi:MAG TPA: glycosyltransferase family 4 protein [bacterium]|nr:glycosyltransferase family 4 protein [bacterium]
MMKNKSKLLFVEMSRNLYEGPARSAVQIINSLDRSRYEPVPVFSLSDGEKNQLEEMIGVNVKTINMNRPTFRMSPGEVPVFVRDTRKSVSEICSYARNTGPDIVHINSLINLHAALSALKLHIPYVLNVREMMTSKKLNRMYIKWICGKAASVVAVSDAVKRRLVDMGVSPQKIEVVYNGTEIVEPDDEKIEVLRKEFSVTQGPLIGIIGTIAELKGQYVMIEALSGLVKDFPGIKLFIVGSKFPDVYSDIYMREMLRLIEKCGIGNNVVFTGARNDVAQLMHMLDVVVQPSVFYDSLPRSVMEAMASGKPVVGSDIGGIPEMIIDGETGYIVEPRRPDRLEEAIRSLLSDSGKIIEMGRAAKERAEKHFSNTGQTLKLMEIYDRVLREA